MIINVLVLKLRNYINTEKKELISLSFESLTEESFSALGILIIRKINYVSC